MQTYDKPYSWFCLMILVCVFISQQWSKQILGSMYGFGVAGYNEDSYYKIDKAVVSRFSCMRVPFPDNNTIIKYINSLGITKNISNILKNIDNNLYNLEVCINHKNYKHPINVFIKKIDDILHKSSLIFIDDLRKILHKLHLLNFNPYLTIKEYIKLCVKSKEYSIEELQQITSKAANLSTSEPYNKYFFSLEDFFIFIKTILFKKEV